MQSEYKAATEGFATVPFSFLALALASPVAHQRWGAVVAQSGPSWEEANKHVGSGQAMQRKRLRMT
jgi:hypothetical protein